MAGSSPASSNSDSEGEALELESPLSGSSSMNSSAAEADIFSQLAPISFDKDGFETNIGLAVPRIFTARCQVFFFVF